MLILIVMPEIKSQTIYNSEYGKCFTPKRDLKVLIVCVRFKNYQEDPNNINWPANQELPSWANDSFLFNDLSDFNNIDTNNKGLSRYYYEMTKNLPEEERFKVYGEFLPIEIDLPSSSPAGNWYGINLIVLDSLKSKYGNTNFLNSFDIRGKAPEFSYDQSLNKTKDSIIDFMVINYRYSSGLNQFYSGMNNWGGSGGGFTGVPSYSPNKYVINNNIKITYSQSFTAIDAINFNLKLYTHEIGHQLYFAPHYGGCNGVFGYYLQSTSSGGMMTDIGHEVYGGANAWERWYLGWINIKNDLKDSTDNGIYTLGDYFTTGDAIRIKLPYVENQYLWLENHQGNNLFDNRTKWVSELCGYPLPSSPRGLLAYIEEINYKKEFTSYDSLNILYDEYSNAIRLLSREGNSDFIINNTIQSPELCGNTIPNFTISSENPYSGNNKSSKIFWDKNNDGEIDWTSDYNRGPSEQDYVSIIDGNVIYGNFATNAGFQLGDSIGIDTNPPIENIRRYKQSFLYPIFLNGISIKIIDQDSSGNMTLRVRFNDYNFNNDIRMCGDVLFPPDTVNINANITIDESETLNREFKLIDHYDNYSRTIELGFVNPSLIKTINHSYLKVNGNIIIKKGSTFILDTNSTIDLRNNSKIIVDSSASLIIRANSNLILHDNSKIEIKKGGFLCVSKDANINLTNGGGINFYYGANYGTTQYVEYFRYNRNCNCLSTIDSINYIGCGLIIDSVITETTGNETWTTPKTLGEDFKVKSGHTLTIQNTTISLTPRVKIKIEPNAKLIVDNSTLTSYAGGNCEGDYWGAIEVYGNKNQRQLQQYQGYLELKNNSIIENARNAVSLWKSDDWNSMGGIVNASNTTFRNNIRSVEFVSYQNINQNNEEIDNVNKFVNCTFEWDANMYPHDKTNLNHVTLWNVKGVKFIACDFKNTLTNKISKLGIYSEEAGFGVYGKLINFDIIDRSEFINLTYGVRTANIAHSKNFTVQNSYFENNFCGIFTVASNNITIQDNEFRIHPIYKPQEDYPNYAAFGVTVHNCARYQIQRNDFIGENNEEYNYKIGTQIKNSGEGANRVNDNNFINLFQASQAIGNNRGINNRASTGLKYICNHFEDSEYGIIITPDNQYRTNGIAINQDGGDITLSAENTFAQNTTIIGSDIFNDNTSGINYYSTQIGNKKPIAITSLVYNCLATDNNGVCSKNYGLLDNITLNNTFVALENDYISLLYNYNNLLDGGSTDNLLDKIQNSWDGDVWNLREEFLGQSPYLSPEVLKELALSERLPLPVYLEIAISNPEATQKDEYIDFMKSDEGINILTTNGIELITDSWDTKTFRSTVESNISSKLSDMEAVTRTQLDRSINDTTGFNISNYRSLLDNIRNIDAKYELVDSYIETKEYVNARELLNSLLTDPEILKYNETDINDYLSLIDIMEGRDSTNQIPLNEQLINLSQSTTRAGSKARASLNFYDSNTNYHPDYVVIDNKKSAKIKIKRPLNAFEADVSALPNPAKDYIAISYNLKPQTTEYMIKIYDDKGIVVYSGSLKGNKGIQNIDTRTFNSGTYVYNVENENERFKSGKFIIVR
ncbi:MAG: T9SS type A sorting domain-containing protein [Bacteroidales bacterium]